MKLIDVIKYDFDEKEVAYRHPSEDFNNQTVLIVQESQYAIFIKSGKFYGSFTSGRYKLDSENLPLIKNLQNIGSDGFTTFSSTIYFINLKSLFNIKWGTPSSMSILDPIYNVILPVGASGQMILKIIDPERFLLKFVGTRKKLEEEETATSIKSIIITKIKDIIAESIIDKKISILMISKFLFDLSEEGKELLTPLLLKFGLELDAFSIENIVVDQTDPSFIRLRNAIARKSEMDILGFNYQDERKFDILQDAAKNEGVGGSIIGTGLGLGMGVAVGGSVGNFAADKLTNQITVQCPSCNYNLASNMIFCPNCGKDTKPKDKLIVCKHCNTPIGSGKFCSNCGKTL